MTLEISRSLSKHFSLFSQGVLRIHFIEAQDLEGKDTYLKGIIKGKSDPYGIIRVGNQIFQSKVIKENLSPKWNEVYEVQFVRGCTTQFKIVFQ